MKHRMQHLAVGLAAFVLAGLCLAAAALAWLRAAAGAVASAALISAMPAAAEPAEDFWYGTTLAPQEAAVRLALPDGQPLGSWSAAPPGTAGALPDAGPAAPIEPSGTA